jgi:PIN domain nuclease of toxin-antitoxin system
VRLLLDTHVLLWALGEPGKLRKSTRLKIESPRNTILVSAVSIWEIETKRAIGKLRIRGDVDSHVEAARMQELPLRISHCKRLSTLPNIHRDPFDRMLVAQALVEELVLVTADEDIARYPIRTLPA